MVTDPVRLIRLPGVYRAQHDTWLLARSLLAERGLDGARVLDMCTGTGALAVLAAARGAAQVTAVDVSVRAVLTARVNAAPWGTTIRVRRGGLPSVPGIPFHVVLANPPYVPSARAPRRSARQWAAGVDGRAVLDPLCVAAPRLLRPGGVLLLVQSTLSDQDRTLASLRERGLHAEIVARQRLPFGPVLRDQRQWLLRQRRIGPDQNTEELVVIRACRS